MPNNGHDEPAPALLARHRRSGGAHVGYRRVTGVHRAEGIAGPTRRYLFTVALLVSTSSLPILAAIGSGSATVADGMPPAGDTPFIASPSGGPLVVVPPTAPPAEPAGSGDRNRRTGWRPLPIPTAAWQADAVSPPSAPDRTPIVRPGPNEPVVPPPTPAPTPEPTGPSPAPSPEPSPSPSPTPSHTADPAADQSAAATAEPPGTATPTPPPQG